MTYIKRKHGCVWCRFLWEVTQWSFSDVQIYVFRYTDNVETRLSLRGSNPSSMNLQRIGLCVVSPSSLALFPISLYPPISLFPYSYGSLHVHCAAAEMRKKLQNKYKFSFFFYCTPNSIHSHHSDILYASMLSIENCSIWSESPSIVNDCKPEKCVAFDYTSTSSKWPLYLSRFKMTSTVPLSGF